MKKKRKLPEEPSILETYQIGNTIIRIAGDCIVQSQEEIDQIVDDLHAVGWQIIEGAYKRGEQI